MCFNSDPAPAAPTGPSAEKLAEQERKRQLRETSKRIVESAREADTMRGRRGNIATSATGDPAYGMSIEATSPVALNDLPLGRTRLGK